MPDRLWLYHGAEQPDVYELLNQCTDPDQHIEAFLYALVPPDQRVLLDIGAGAGYHAVRYAERYRHVFALEPDPRMLALLHCRLTGHSTGNVSVLACPAGEVPLADASVDVAIARFAYFFGTDDCLPGLAEVRRVLRPGGHLVVIEANAGRGQMGAINRLAYPVVFDQKAQDAVRGFFRKHGFAEYEVHTTVRAPDRQALETILRWDYPSERVPDLLTMVAGLELTHSLYAFVWSAA